MRRLIAVVILRPGQNLRATGVQALHGEVVAPTGEAAGDRPVGDRGPVATGAARPGDAQPGDAQPGDAQPGDADRNNRRT
jgi:hypothetical protein